MNHCENCGQKLNFRNRVPGLNRCVDCQKEYVQALKRPAEEKPSGSGAVPLGTLPETSPVQQHQSHAWRWIIGVPVAIFVLAIIGAMAGPSTTTGGSSSSGGSTSNSSSSSRSISVPAQAPAPVTHQVRYLIEVDPAGASSITYDNDQGGIEQVGNYSGDWDKTYAMRNGQFAAVSAQNQHDHGYVNCSIFVDGQLWKHSESKGGYVIADCNGLVGR